MAWIESHQSLGKHPKVLRLAGELKVHKMQAIGHLHGLWWWALEYAADGDLSKFEAAEIEAACEWPGIPGALNTALRNNGWIDQNKHIHDWDKFTLHYDHMLEKKERQLEQVKARVRAFRDRKRSRNAPVTQCNAPTKPNQPNLTNQTKPNLPKEDKRVKFEKPTPEQVAAYATEKGFTAFDADYFCDYYTARGWKVGAAAMRDWQAACRTWQKRKFSDKGGSAFGKVIKPRVGYTGEFVPTKKVITAADIAQQ